MLAEDLHFGHAAQHLSISQPVLSRQIRQLERSLGVDLFVRSKRSVRLTAPGAVLAEQARRAIEQADQAVESTLRASRGEAGSLRVGFVASAANSVLPAAVAQFREERPDVALSLIELRDEEQIEGLVQDRLDVGLIHAPVSSRLVCSETLLVEPYAAVLPMGHALATAQRISLSALADEDFVMWPRRARAERFDYLIAACQGCGFSPRIVQEAGTTTAILGLVSAGMGVTLLAYSNRALNRNGVAFVPVEGLEATLSVVWRGEPASPTTNRFLAVARYVARRPF